MEIKSTVSSFTIKRKLRGRLNVDKADRNSLHQSLEVVSDSPDEKSHPDGELMNIVTGQSAHQEVNVDDAVAIGNKALGDFKSRWPDSFHEPLAKIVVTMDV